jgi:GNAT superfamily N-acetyltransferase
MSEHPSVAIRHWITEDDEPALAIWSQTAPHLPPLDVDVYRARREAAPKDRLQVEWVADEGGTVVGTAVLAERAPGTHSFLAEVVVDRSRRRRGIGSTLYDTVAGEASAAGAQKVYGYVWEGDRASLAFVEKRDFHLTGRGEAISRLDVAAANLEGFAGVEERLESEGILIQTLQELGLDDEGLLHRIYDLDTATHTDIQSSEPFEPFPFREWVNVAVLGPGRSADSCWIALDGEKVVGLARMQRQGDSAWNAFTGVDSSYRGRGIARALKLKTIEWSKANGVRFHYTGNEVANARMLAINETLGYEPLPAELEVLKELR